MNIKDKIVSHKIFGEGKVVDHTGGYLTILFSQGEKKFVFPDSFKGFLKAKDEALHTQIQIELAGIEQQKRMDQQEREQERNVLLEKQRLLGDGQIAQRKSKEKVYPRENIAFKCNFCDGGKTTDNIGFNGICSDEQIKYNIEKGKHVWCSSPNCPCREFYDGDISTYSELQKVVEDDYNGFICYESTMLRDWKASAGVVQTGERKGMPMRLVKVQVNSLAVLTTRLPYETDENRFIFAVFLVDETYEGDARDEGYVSTDSKYKIQMTLDEAQKLKFWNYYFCANAPEVIKFGSGLHRYLSDDQAAQILKDITELKKGTAQEALAQEFFEYFCKRNGIDIDNIPPNAGALIIKKA